MFQHLKGHHQAAIPVYNIQRISDRFFNSTEISIYNSWLCIAVQSGLIIKMVLETLGLLVMYTGTIT